MDNSINKEMAKCLEAEKPEIEKGNLMLQWTQEVRNAIEGCPAVSEADEKCLEVTITEDNFDNELDVLFLNIGNWEKGISELTG